MTESETLSFEQCALASGLLTRAQLDEAAAKLQWTLDDGSTLDSPAKDQQLANLLVKSGLLNVWQAQQLLEGQIRFNLGPYRILDSLGRGGMGHVYLARHAVLNRQVAIKVLPRDRSTPEAIDNFTREIRAQASLNHENLVRALDAGHDRNVYYLVAEYVPGADLRKLARRTGPMSMQMAASIISQVARGLEHAHQRGLVHRDVKPGNVLVTPDGIAKLSDLGLAGAILADPRDPRFGKIVGTADYLSPDHIKTPWAPTPAWDVYSLGCTLYFAVTSKVPFPGGSTADKARAHCHGKPLDPRRLNPTLSVEFVEVLADMMAKNAGERIATAAEVVQRLAPWVGQPIPIPEAAGGKNAPPAKIFASASRLHAGSLPPNQDDTQDIVPGIDDSCIESHEDLSQRSQITQPIASAHQETRQAFDFDESISDDQRPRKTLAPLLVYLVLPLALLGLLMGLLWLF